MSHSAETPRKWLRCRILVHISLDTHRIDIEECLWATFYVTCFLERVLILWSERKIELGTLIVRLNLRLDTGVIVAWAEPICTEFVLVFEISNRTPALASKGLRSVFMFADSNINSGRPRYFSCVE